MAPADDEPPLTFGLDAACTVVSYEEALASALPSTREPTTEPGTGRQEEPTSEPVHAAQGTATSTGGTAPSRQQSQSIAVAGTSTQPAPAQHARSREPTMPTLPELQPHFVVLTQEYQAAQERIRTYYEEALAHAQTRRHGRRQELWQAYHQATPELQEAYTHALATWQAMVAQWLQLLEARERTTLSTQEEQR